jgi:CRISPR-associated endonuclease/helicase Cas3
MPVEFWAKTTVDDQLGISVLEHMENVGYVASCLAEIVPDLLERFEIGAAEVGALAALHDVGKISPGFQQNSAAWLEANGLTEIARRWTWDTRMESDHGKVTHAAVQRFLVTNGANRRAAKFLSAVLGGHHGRVNPPNDRGFQPSIAISEEHSGIDWGKERDNAARAICSAFGATLGELAADSEPPALWWLAGLTSVADWIGSDENFFAPERGAVNTNAAAIALRAVTTIGLAAPEVQPGLSFHDLFHAPQRPDIPFTPNDMQLRAMSAIAARGVYVIEGPMGTGKTEAALAAAYQLLANRKARGIFFALPTRATSNRMYLRMAEFVRRIAPAAAGSRLIHGNSWLLDERLGVSPSASGPGTAAEDARAGRDWFASAKRALLAPFGVGTIDQALLGVVAAKHFFVRCYALAGKVVILDEVHSYEIYTGTLVDKLISMLEELGCTVIVPSATLTRKRRNQMVGAGDENEDEADLHYLLITGRRSGEDSQSL